MKVRLFKIRISEDFLVQDQNRLDEFISNNEIIKCETAFVQDKEYYWSVLLFYQSFYKEVVEEAPNKDMHIVQTEDSLRNDEVLLLESLKLWRSEKAKEQSLPTYFVASNNVLLSVVKRMPNCTDDLMKIKGFGKHKIENYGEEIIQLLAKKQL